jgi:ADP-ribose pyrophosphatase YjhB (NUDIX family)
MTNIIECADVIAKFADAFVVIERFTKPRGLAFPGGKVDSGETTEVAARREFFEETRLTLVIEGVVGFYDAEGRDPRGPYVSTVFHGVGSGAPKEEFGKTRVLLLSREEIESRSGEFVADHFQMFTDYVKENCS